MSEVPQDNIEQGFGEFSIDVGEQEEDESDSLSDSTQPDRNGGNRDMKFEDTRKIISFMKHPITQVAHLNIVKMWKDELPCKSK